MRCEQPETNLASDSESSKSPDINWARLPSVPPEACVKHRSGTPLSTQSFRTSLPRKPVAPVSARRWIMPHLGIGHSRQVPIIHLVRHYTPVLACCLPQFLNSQHWNALASTISQRQCFLLVS